jgi:hypothetical protein
MDYKIRDNAINCVLANLILEKTRAFVDKTLSGHHFKLS